MLGCGTSGLMSVSRGSSISGIEARPLSAIWIGVEWGLGWMGDGSEGALRF